MKRALSVLAQFLLLLIVDAVGSLVYHPFHIQTPLTSSAVAQRSFLWDGLILMFLLYVILLLIAWLRKRLGPAGPAATIALALAVAAGYFLKLGFITHNW